MSNLPLSGIVRSLLQGCCGLTRTHILVASMIAGLALVTGPVRADMSDVTQEVERAGTARVVITFRTGQGGDRRPWAMAQSVEQQRRVVQQTGVVLEHRMRDANIPLVKRYATLPFAGAIVNREQLAALAAMPEVAEVRLVQVQRKQPTATIYSARETQQSASLTASVASIDVPGAWAAGYEGQGTTVAVLDGGFNINHPMLRGKNVGDACFADSYGTTLKAQCPSGQTPQIGAGAASNCPSTSDRCDHGSNVSSIAVGNDGTNFGVARAAKFMPIDVFSLDSDRNDCSPDPAPCEVTDSIAILDALDYINDNAATYNVVAVNLSLGGSTTNGYCDNDPRKTAIDNLRAKGIAVVIAAGNDGLNGRIEEPACISTSEAVGATDNSTNVASFSNFATTVDLMAPGISIAGAAGVGTGTVTMSGTSQATPHISGSWAIMRAAFPAATADQIERALKSTGAAVTRGGTGYTVPKVQVLRAINFMAGHNRLLFNQIVTDNAKTTLGLSYLRVYNSSASAGTITFTLRDALTGTAVGTWTSPSIQPKASPQFGLANIQANAVPALGQAVSSDSRTYYNVEAQSTFSGYVQYVLWSTGVGVLGNLTSCPAGLSTNGTTLLNVDSASVSDYVSHIRIVNSGSVASAATLVFSDPNTGQAVAQWQSTLIPSGASLDVAEPQIEAGVTALSSATAAGASQYNVSLTNFAGFIQHVIENRRVGVLTDISAKCDLTSS